jgi:hypothetical protein
VRRHSAVDYTACSGNVIAKVRCSAGFTGIARRDLFETPGNIGAIYFTVMWSDHKIAIALRVQLSAVPNLESGISITYAVLRHKSGGIAFE